MLRLRPQDLFKFWCILWLGNWKKRHRIGPSSSNPDNASHPWFMKFIYPYIFHTGHIKTNLSPSLLQQNVNSDRITQWLLLSQRETWNIGEATLTSLLESVLSLMKTLCGGLFWLTEAYRTSVWYYFWRYQSRDLEYPWSHCCAGLGQGCWISQ